MRWVLIGLLMSTGTAVAHEGVKNPGVMARMHAMKDMGAEVKALVAFIEGKQAFDAERVQARVNRLAEDVARTGALFKGADEDPKSEALPVIWEDFADFEARAEAVETFLRAEAAGLQSVDDLGPFVQKLGAQCKACHRVYRK